MKQDSERKPFVIPEQSHKERPVLGQFLGLCSALSWVISGTCVQMLEGFLPPLELNCWRFGGPIPFFLLWIIIRKLSICYPPKTLLLLFGLSVTFALVNYTFFGSLEYIAIGDTESLNSATLLIFTAVVSSVFLKEKIGVIKALSIILSIVGVVFVTQPDFIFPKLQPEDFSFQNQTSLEYDATVNNELIQSGSKINESNATVNSPDTSKHYIGYILVTLSGLSCSSSVLFIRAMSSTGEVTSDVQVIATHVIGFVISAVLMGILEKPKLPVDLNGCLYLTGHVIFSYLGNVCFYVGLNIASGVLVVLAYTPAIVFSMIVQYFITFSIQPGQRNVLEIFGAILVFVAACMNPLHHIVTEKQDKNKNEE